MKDVVFVLAALIVVSAVVRRVRRGSERPPHPAVRAWHAIAARREAKRPPRRSLLGDIGLVAAREIRERVRGRFFKVITLLLLAVVGAAVVVPTLRSSSRTQMTIGVVGPLASALRGSVVHAAAADGITAHLVTEPSVASSSAALRSGAVGLVIDHGSSLLVKTAGVATGTSATAKAVHSIATLLGVDQAFHAAGLSPAQAATIARARALPVTSLAPSRRSSAAVSTALIGLVLVFIMLTQYNTWTLMGVMEEKASRVVEVLLATIRPIELLAGKVLGIGLLALVQAGAVVGFALVLADAVGSSLLKGTAPLVVVATLVWLVLGYVFYSWVYAAAGSMAERQDQIQSLVMPLSVPLIFGYVVALTSVQSTTPSLLITILAYLPPTAPFGMPVLVADGRATWWQFALAVLVSLAATVAVARLAAGVYRRAVLRTGRRVRLHELVAASKPR